MAQRLVSVKVVTRAQSVQLDPIRLPALKVPTTLLVRLQILALPAQMDLTAIKQWKLPVNQECTVI
jgi:hypothetical protein